MTIASSGVAPSPAAGAGPYGRGAITFYWIMFVLVVGVVTFIWHGRMFDFGLFQVDFGVHSNKAVFHPTEDVHGYLAYALFALAGAHALTALWHHFIRRDGILRRMWP